MAQRLSSDQKLYSSQGKPRVFFLNDGSSKWVKKIIKKFMIICPGYAVDWVDKSDPSKSADAKTMRDIILQSSIFFPCFSEAYLAEPNSLNVEINLVLSNNKRMIPIIIDDVDIQLISEIRNMYIIVCPTGLKSEQIKVEIEKLKATIDDEDPALRHACCHTILLQRAISWEEKGRPPIPKRDENSDILHFLNNCAMGYKPTATNLMLEYLLGQTPQKMPSLRLPVSSSAYICSVSDDAIFANVITETLKKSNRKIWCDLRRTEFTTDRQIEVINAVTEHDVFLFIWTPNSASDPECIFVLQQATEMFKKRTFIITCTETDETKVPADCSEFLQLERIFIPRAGDGNTNFDVAIRQLETKMDVNSLHIKSHTRFLLMTHKWVQKKQSKYLLSQDEEKQMSKWLLACMIGFTPYAASGHMEFLKATRESSKTQIVGEDESVSIEFLTSTNISGIEALDLVGRFYPLTYCVPRGRHQFNIHGFLQISLNAEDPQWEERFMVVFPAGFFQVYAIRKNHKEMYSEMELHEELENAKLEDVPIYGLECWKIAFRSGKVWHLKASTVQQKTKWTQILSKLTEVPCKLDPLSFLEGHLNVRSAKEEVPNQRYCVMGKTSGKKYFNYYDNTLQNSELLQELEIRFIQANEQNAESFVLSGSKEDNTGFQQFTYLCTCNDEETAKKWTSITQEQDEMEKLLRITLEFKELSKFVEPHDVKKDLTNCFRGENLITYLLSCKKSPTNTEASKLANELLQTKLIDHVPGDDEKEGVDQLFYPKEWYMFGSEFEKQSGPSVQDLLRLDDVKEGSLVSGYMYFAEGSKYGSNNQRVFVVLRPNTDNMYFFHTKNSKTPHIIFRDCWVSLSIEIVLSKLSPKHGIIILNRETILRLSAEGMGIWLQAFQASNYSITVMQYKIQLVTSDSQQLKSAPRTNSSISKAMSFLNLKYHVDNNSASRGTSRKDLQELRTKILIARESHDKIKVKNYKARTFEELITEGNETRRQGFSDIIATENLMLRELAHIVRNYLQPLSTQMEECIDMTRLLETSRDLYTVHTNFQAELVKLMAEEGDTDSRFLLAIIENIQRILVRQQFFTLNIISREQATEILWQAKEKISNLLLLPSERVRHYVLMLERIQTYTSPSHKCYQLFATFIPKIWNVAKKVRDCYHSTEQAAWSVYLDSKVTNIPDNWKILTPNEEYIDQGVFKYVFGMGRDTDAPPDEHPIKDSRGETVRGFLFQNSFLLTTWKYKYRYRLDLKEVSPRPKFKLLINLMSDMYSITDLLKAETSDACTQSITTLVCDSQRERDAWLVKLEKATSRTKSKVKSSPVTRKRSIRGQKGDVSKVNLYLRVRPFVHRDEKDLGQICLEVDETKEVATLNQDSLDISRGDRVARYDKIFGTDDKQVDVFNTVGTEVLGAVFAGYNIAIIAYGNTGAGKTFTMFGEGNSELKGLIPRLLEEICQVFNKPGAYHKHNIQISYVQVYNDQIQDLQGTKNKKGELPVVDIKINKKGEHKLKRVTKTKVTTLKEAMSILIKGNKKRATRKHNMNEVSSRSHAIMIMYLTAQKTSSARSISSQAYLVDLAGSENVVKTGVKGQGLREAKFVNKSLITLGRVVNGLNENARRTKGKKVAIPFRESKLTQILNEPLTKDFICTVILNVSCSPALGQAQETAKTMTFGGATKKLNKTSAVKDQKLQNWLTGVWTSISSSR